MQCIICKIYFWNVFHKYYNFIYTPICTKFLFLQKVGVTICSRGGALLAYLILKEEFVATSKSREQSKGAETIE
jgi:hypothetical protein